MPKYATITDVIDYEVAPALDEFVDDFDVVEIASIGLKMKTNCRRNCREHITICGLKLIGSIVIL